MAYLLYGAKGTGSMAIEAALDEVGVEWQAVNLDRKAGEHVAAAYTAINPRQQVPALVVDQALVLTETTAMLTWLGDRHAEAGLIPAPGSPDRARHDRWLAFLQANVYEGFLREAYPHRYTDDPAGTEAVARSATAYVRRHFELIDGQLGAGPFLLGARLQMVDIYLWMLCWWAEHDWLAAACPGLDRLQRAAGTRPALERAAVRHFDRPRP